jgi:WD40 repeat protein
MLTRSNGTFIVYSKSSLQPVAEQRIPVTNLWTSEIAPDGRHFACWCSDGALRVFQTEPIRQTAVFRTDEGPSGALAFSPDGKMLGACSGENMWVWDLEAHAEIMRDSAVPGGAIMAVRFSPDGQSFICSRAFGSAFVWDLALKRRIGTFPGPRDHTYDGAVDPSRRFVATAGSEDATRLWDPLNGTQIVTLRGLPPYNYSVAFSPDGRRLATGGGPYVTIWDMNTKREIGVLKSAHGAVNWLEFTDDGSSLLVATDQGVFSWQVPSFEEIARAESQSQR